ncbi:MAG: AraC family transcriptional regulator [bacterium]|nr:AraC family transcriptional regulator [bacterium]MCM1373967.1 AraC family transcriptional regulator [Muribaculum sp.]
MTPSKPAGYHNINKITIYRRKRSDNTPLRPSHYHNFYEIFCPLSGKCRFLLQDQIHELGKGDLAFITPGVMHHSRHYPDANYEIIHILFKKSFLLHDVIGETSSYVGSIPSLYLGDYSDLLLRMLSESVGLDEYSDGFTSCYLQQFLLFLARHSVMYQAESELINVQDADIQRATRYIYQNYDKQLTLEELAEIAALSPTYFSKKFKLVTGAGFKEYLNYVRLKHAQTALLTTSHSVADISRECGFQDNNYFRDLFRNVYGLSPKEYRKHPEVL